jgi:hypothetical protein
MHTLYQVCLVMSRPDLLCFYDGTVEGMSGCARAKASQLRDPRSPILVTDMRISDSTVYDYVPWKGCYWTMELGKVL